MPEYEFLKSSGRYRNKITGEFVTEQQLYEWVETTVEVAGANIEIYARQLIAGEINRAEWAISAGTEIRDMHRAVSMIAFGGKANMGPSEWGFVGSAVRREMSYFNVFASLVDETPIEALGEAFVSRAVSYFHSAYTTFAQALRRRIIAAGQAATELNILESGAEHCDGCLVATAMGEVPVGTLVPIGSRDCGLRCKCRIIYIREDAA